MDFLVVRSHTLVFARQLVAAALMLCSAQACALPAQSASLQPASPQAAATQVVAQVTDTIWYVTNRAPKSGGWQNERGAGLTYGVRSFQVVPKPGKQFPWSAAIRKNVLADSQISREAWSERLVKSSLQDGAADLPVLVYVHGYASSFKEATEQAAELRRRGNFKGPLVVFSWPASGSGFAAPTLDHMLTRAYWRDADRAKESIPDLVTVLQDLTRQLGASRVVIAAHSMGNMMLDGALRDSTLADSLAITPLRAVAYLAPDVDETYFADSLVTFARGISSRQVLYGSRNDRLLQISSVVHGAPRAGQLVRKAPWSADLEVLDVTDARVSGNWWIRHFGTNHAFRRRPDAVSDFFGLVLRDLPADCRGSSEAWTRSADGSWRLQRAVPQTQQASASSVSPSADADSISRPDPAPTGPACTDAR